MNTLRRLVDRWRHPGEYPTQRRYRRWRDTLEGHAPSQPYQLTAARITPPPPPEGTNG